MRFRLINAHESFSSSLMSRSRHVWWVARSLMRCGYLSRLWVALRWWIALSLMKCNRLSRLIKDVYVARQVKNEHTSLDTSKTGIRHSMCREWACVIRWIETRQSETDDEMIKRDHENESSSKILARKKFESHFSDYISHRDKTQNTLSTYSRSKSSHQYSSQ